MPEAEDFLCTDTSDTSTRDQTQPHFSTEELEKEDGNAFRVYFESMRRRFLSRGREVRAFDAWMHFSQLME